MLRPLAWGLLLAGIAAAGELPSLFWSYRGTVTFEGERLSAPGIPEEDARILSFYNKLEGTYDLDERLFLSLGGKANLVPDRQAFGSEDYNKGLPGREDLERAMVHQAAVTWDDGFFALCAGRQQVRYDWLEGSVDGVTALAGDDRTTSLRLFWFNRYEELLPVFHMAQGNINDGYGLYGAIFRTKTAGAEATLFDYHLPDLRNYAGGRFHLTRAKLGLNLNYARADALSLALYEEDETYAGASVEGLWGDHYLEAGFSQTGEKGMIALIQMGSYMFGQFYLTGQVDRENAFNRFIRYIRIKGPWRFQAVTGATTYDNTFFRLEKGLTATETDLTLAWKPGGPWSFDAGYMRMDADNRDPIQANQQLLRFSGSYAYGN